MKKTLLLILLFTFFQTNAQQWKKIATGTHHTAAIKIDSTLWVWGYNSKGQLGDGTFTKRANPVKIGASKNWKSVAAGEAFTLALKSDGTLWTWGDNYYGQLCDGTTTNSSVPKQIGTATDWQSISVGDSHAVALKNDGTLWTWGNNYYGQLGDNTTANKNNPVQIGTDSDWQIIEAGSSCTFAIKNNGTLWAWGKNNSGQLGDNSTTDVFVPKQIGTANDWKTISSGYHHTVALKTDGSLWAWGESAYGNLGSGYKTDYYVPTKIGISTDWKSVSVGGDQTIALKTNGALWGWGYNLNGQLGNGTNINSLSPIQIGSSTNWQEISAGSFHSLALKTDSSIWAMGQNTDDQLGDGSGIDKNVPTEVLFPETLTADIATTDVSCSGSYTGAALVISVSGGTAPYTYLWSNGAKTAKIEGLAAGQYTCTITDANSSSRLYQVEIKEPALLTGAVSLINNCNINGATLTAVATGGTLPYKYSISGLPFQDSNVFPGLAPGNYEVTVKDAAGCLFMTFLVVDNYRETPTVSAQTFYDGATVANLNAINPNFRWYKDTTTPTTLPYSTLLQSGTYYVSQINQICESERVAVSVTILPSILGKEIPKNGLLAYYSFNGNANDSSGKESNGIASNVTLVQDRFGKNNQAYSFNGTSSGIEANVKDYPLKGESRTITGWFKAGDPKVSQESDFCVLNYGNVTDPNYWFKISLSKKGYLDLQMDAQTFSSQENYLNDQWTFFAMVFDGDANTFSLYINNVLKLSGSADLYTQGFGTLFRIGKNKSNNYFEGSIDDIGIWNRVLTSEEVAALYTLGEQPAYTLIPNANFEQKLINLGIDSGTIDGKVLTSNIKNVKSLNVSQSNISDLTGIQDFVSLTNLYCSQNTLTALNVSKNTALTILDCNNNQITALDVSNNIALNELICYSNKLTSLDVKANTALTKLDSGSNQYTSLDVSANTALTFLGCNTSRLSTINVSKNNALTLFDCRENYITNLDVTNLTALKELYCQSNQLKVLDVSKNKFLELINCSKNQLTTLDISMHPNAIGLYANSNQLTSLNLKNGNNINFQLLYLNLKNNPNLSCIQVDEKAYSDDNWSTKKDATAIFNTVCDATYTLIPDSNFEKSLIALGIDNGTPDGKILTKDAAAVTNLELYDKSITDLTGIEAFTSLKVLNCGANQLTSLDLSSNLNLTQLECYQNKLTTINISKNAALTYFDCFENQLTSLDLSHNNELETVYCYGNQLTSLNVTNATKLVNFDCVDNKLTSVDFSTNTALSSLYCYKNQLTTLDLSKNKALTELVCYDNQLTSLNLKNGNNLNFTIKNSKFTNNPNLTCIQVDDAAYSNANWSVIKDAGADYNTICTPISVAIPDQNFEQKLVDLGIDTDGVNGKISAADASAVTSLDVSNSNIKDLKGIEIFTSLIYLDVSNNQLSSLDVSQNSLLETLNASSNQLTSLDLSANHKLIIAYVASNPLQYINLQNGNNKNMIIQSVTTKNTANTLATSFLGLTNLGCVKVDDVVYSNANWSKIKETTTVYSATCSLGIEESTFDKAVLYPNPTKGEINILNVELQKANVYNTLGQLVKSFTLVPGSSDHTIDLANLPKGVYYIYLINQDKASAKKIIVE